MKNTITRKNHISLFFAGTLILIAFVFVITFFPITTKANQTGYVNGSYVNVRMYAGTWAPVVGTVSYCDVDVLGSENDMDGDLWYKIDFNGGEYFVYGEYVSLSDGSNYQNVSVDNGSYEEQLSRFPEAYKPLIEEIHKAYPNYIFQADYVNTSYDDAVYAQTQNHRKLVNLYADGVSWRSLSSDCYDRSCGTWANFSGDWTDAGIDVIEYYMDPRNFLTTQNMYIFAQQTYSGQETVSGLETICAGSFLAGNYTDITGTHSYIDTIMQVAAESKVSPYVIAATLRQEQPSYGDSPLIDGSHGFYNFFNFAASGSDVVGNGINYAREQGWDTVYKSILGGAKGYYNGYLKNGQDTYFYKDFNLVNGDYNHQYAQCVYDQMGNAAFLRDAISSDYNATVTLRIPVYTDLPITQQEYPEENGSLNKRYDSNGNVLGRSTGIIEIPQDTTPVTTVINDVTDEPKKVIETKTFEKGDANGDGKISALDYVAVKNHIMGSELISEDSYLEAADANGDGKISALDYVKIKNIIMGR